MKSIFAENLVVLDGEQTSKEEILSELADLMDRDGRLKDKEDYMRHVMEREKECSTALETGYAIPHGKCNSVKEPSVAFARLKKGITWGEDDEEKIQVIFLLAVPEANAGNLHLKILSKLARRLMDNEFCNRINSVKTPEELVRVISF